MNDEAVARDGGDVGTDGTTMPPWSREVMPRLPILFGLAALAVTQPMLDILGSNPEFFVAANLRPLQIVVVAVLVAVVPALVLWLAGAVASAAHLPTGRMFHHAAVFGLGALLVLGFLRITDIDRLWLVAVVTAVAAAAITVLERRAKPFRSFLTFLAVANVAFVALFLFANRSADLIWADDGEAVEPVALGETDTPVVWIVLDEFPLATILRPDGTINEARFPSLAALAEESTWYRNAATPASLTTKAVPAVLTGRVPESGDLPTFESHPQNLFTLLGSEMTVDRYEIVTDLCPENVCAAKAAGSIRRTLADVAVVFGHQKLPHRLRQELPAIDDGWGGFTGLREEGTVRDDAGDSAGDIDPYERWNAFGPEVRGPQGQMAALDELSSSIDADPALTFIHVALPHAVWLATPYDGAFNSVLVRHRVDDPDNPRYEYSYRQMLQIHTLQASATDQAIGRLIDHLKDIGIWDDALFVLTSDHGESMLPPQFGRKVTEENVDAVLRVPMFVKTPQQDRGETSDVPASTLDLVPSVADLLDAEVDWEFDGHSLYDGSEATTERRVTDDLDGLLATVSRIEAMFGAPTIDGLAAVGPHADLVGDEVGDHTVGEPSELDWLVDQRDQLASLPNDDGSMPFVISGLVNAESPPDDLIVAVNGQVVGVATGFVAHSGGRQRYGAYLNNAYREGANEITAYEVERQGDEVVLHPLGDID